MFCRNWFLNILLCGNPAYIFSQVVRVTESPVKHLKSNVTKETKIWVSMSLCWSTNTKYHGKGKFPYTQAAIFSSQLWLQTNLVKVLLQIIYIGTRVPKDLIEYMKQLEAFGVEVKLESSFKTDCALKSQVVRMLAFKFKEVI